jgi:uncharacterized protein YkwD
MRMSLACMLFAAAVLAACGRSAPQAPSSSSARSESAPDTSVLGAGPVAASCGIAELPQDILQRINAARAAGQRCGARSMAPALPLKWDPALYGAAAEHSQDMARRNYFEHETPEGQDVGERANAQAYDWKSVGENIAGGDRNVAEVVQAWLASPEHCENIMDPGFRDVAVACVARPGTQWGTYWTMVLGRRR